MQALEATNSRLWQKRALTLLRGWAAIAFARNGHELLERTIRLASIFQVYIVMAVYVVMAYIVMADIVMTYVQSDWRQSSRLVCGASTPDPKPYALNPQPQTLSPTP